MPAIKLKVWVNGKMLTHARIAYGDFALGAVGRGCEPLLISGEEPEPRFLTSGLQLFSLLALAGTELGLFRISLTTRFEVNLRRPGAP